MKKTLFLLTIILFCSCSKEPVTEEIPVEIDPIVIDDSSLLLGKWKLDTIAVIGKKQPHELTVYDYTQDHIIYEFIPDHILRVTGDIDQTDIFKGFESGIYLYELRTLKSTVTMVSVKILYVNDVRYEPTLSANMNKLDVYLITESDVQYYKLVKIE